MIQLDESQQAFCNSRRRNIRLLAPAGCGKTASLLYRCRKLFRRENGKSRFLVVTFTKAAAAELRDRLINDQEFGDLPDGRVMVSTLNAYGWRRIRDRVRNARLLSNPTDLHFAMLNQLRPAWTDNRRLAPIINRRGNNPRLVMEVMDNLKSMGFDHTHDLNHQAFYSRLERLQSQGLNWRIDEQFDLLTSLGVLDEKKRGQIESPSQNRRAFYDRFFTFWRTASSMLLEQSTFTFEDQKYWNYLDLKSPGIDGKRKRPISGAARYDHVFVDEFQDINPLDLALVRVIAERNRATITVVGDDDQAIFEWRGASPEFILNPEEYLGERFTDYQLRTNYRSPEKIVEHSSKLIRNNVNRVSKRVHAGPHSGDAEIELLPTAGINGRLKLVTDIVRGTQPGKVAVIGRLRRQLIPFQIYYASDGAPFKTAADLDVFSSEAFEKLIKLLEIWDDIKVRRRKTQAVDDALAICDLIKRYPLSKTKDRPNLRKHLSGVRPRTTLEAVVSISEYSGPELSGKTHDQLHETARDFASAQNVAEAISAISNGFAGLNFDRERAEGDVWYTDPPLIQLAEIAEGENFDTQELIDRIEFVKENLDEFKRFEDGSEDGDTVGFLQRPLHLMTAHRAKGKEFETVVILDADDRTWPLRPKDQREMEAERRLFYVAFTRARKKVILLHEKDATLSPFVKELDAF